MAFDVLDEHEQGELVQKWLRQNGTSILIGIGVGFLLIFGWQQWKLHNAQHAAEAATQYQVYIDKLDKKDWDAASALAQKLREDYADTAYAVFVAMRQAESALQRGEQAPALEAMQWAHQHSKGDAMQALSGTRLAQIEIAQGKYDDALKVLNELPIGGYAALISELRGDALVALGRRDEAKTAYTETLTNLDAHAPNRANVEMKLNELGVEKQGS